MVKDRLPELLKICSNSAQSLNSTNQCNSDISIEILDEHNSIDSLLNEYADIRILLAIIVSNLETMTRMVQTTNIRNFNENEMDDLRNHNFKIGQQLIQKFNILKQELPINNDFTLEARMKRALFYGLHRTYINIWRKNESFLLSYETKLKKHLQLHTKILNYSSTEEEVEELIANKKTSLFVDNILEDTERERSILRDLMERFSELKKLEKSIEDVHTLFIRIQNLVMEQNELIQVIECHAQQATIRVDKGAEELDQAKVLKEKTLKKKTCLIATGIAILIIFIIFVFV